VSRNTNKTVKPTMQPAELQAAGAHVHLPGARCAPAGPSTKGLPGEGIICGRKRVTPRRWTAMLHSRMLTMGLETLDKRSNPIYL